MAYEKIRSPNLSNILFQTVWIFDNVSTVGNNPNYLEYKSTTK